MKIVTVNVEERHIEAIEKLVGEDGLYPSRSELIRCAVREFLLKELNMAKSMTKYEETEIDDFDSENFVKIPIESKDKKEPIRQFKTYKILRRLENSKDPFGSRDLSEDEEDEYSEEEIQKYFKLGKKKPKEYQKPTLAELREAFPDNPAFRFMNEPFPEKPNI
ncbi:MAG: ribbon-helix-helix protein, CopG family [Promethearchaeota archaeon]|nr:MAG: ribbon-helix-helix protein, CopG family [Candidatus Lokiarchaeota archaeon]